MQRLYLLKKDALNQVMLKCSNSIFHYQVAGLSYYFQAHIISQSTLNTIYIQTFIDRLQIIGQYIMHSNSEDKASHISS